MRTDSVGNESVLMSCDEPNHDRKRQKDKTGAGESGSVRTKKGITEKSGETYRKNKRIHGD